MHNSIASLINTIKSCIIIKDENITIVDNNILLRNGIDTLVYTGVFSTNEDTKLYARNIIRKLANSLGIVSSSIYPLYKAIGEGLISQTFTVPAFNIRALTYDTARIIFRLTQKYKLGPYVFEIARSEIEYTDQEPDEYTVVILAAGIKEEYRGPVFIQGDHYQLSSRRFKENNNEEIDKIKSLIDTSIQAGFLNIDIDASTLVDLEKSSQNEQQRANYEVTSILTKYIRNQELKDIPISIGAEIGHIGGKNSTKDELIVFMENYRSSLPIGMPGISKISVQTGTSHGGIPLADGTMAKVNIDFSALAGTGSVARDKYRLAGVVQHGASTLPNELFDHFPINKTLEIHLATGFQNIVYDTMPNELREEMYAWIEKEVKKEWEDGWTKEQFIYKTRKKAIGPFKKTLWEISNNDKQPIIAKLEQQLTFLFEKLQINNTKDIVQKYVK
ncbi:MAG: class II fructose-bisphosphate aldolase [Candidatus Levybacteria bacterium]|nr:class II fructose-bisphosphate aldolase [Candidatus Levybacteria bacterium]